MFTEKIFVFLWLWLLFLAVLTAVNLICWLATLSASSLRCRFVEKFLDSGDSSKMIPRFVDHFLRPDGVLLLQLLAAHCGHVITASLTGSRGMGWEWAVSAGSDQQKRGRVKIDNFSL
jgi:hypothetical protein